VNWYNGSLDLDLTHDDLNLPKTKDVIIIGNGNVAIDITRIFLKDPNEM
jgi:NADPH-dependent glutamate synthase beta subunit-like oxidoreductase